jgi:glycosyltransferase involved in cell wall biosynthesis
MTPRVSILLPVYNAARYLPAALKSIADQTFTDFEVIAINDGSTDEAPNVLDYFAAKDARFRVVHQTNAGLIATLNRAVERASAPLLARMDNDDIAYPDRLAKQVAFMDANPSVVVLGGAYRLIDEASRPIRTMVPPTDHATITEQCLAGTLPLCHPLVMMRSAAVKQVGGYDARYEAAEDLDLFLKLGEIGHLAALEDTLLDYRQHSASVSGSKQTLQLENQKRAVEAAMQRRGISGTFTPPAPWRPTNADERYKWTCTYGWWALKEGYAATTRAYGLKALRQRPFSKQSWALLFRGIIGSPK